MAIIIGKDSENNLIGTNRDDWVFGLGGNDTLSGGNGSDKLFGGNGNDSIAGGAGNDWIVGGKGNDSLAGGSGADQLIGGSGQDHFVYLTATDSPAAAGWDRILDFTQGQDKIDLAAFRNNSSNLDLIWKGEDPAAPGAWGVWYHNGQTSTCVYADTNGDGIADLKIELKNTCGLNLVASDFIGVSEAQMNVAPVLDLDANNSAAVGTNYATTFTENGAPVAIADADVGITDVDDTHIVSASITLTNPQIGDSLVAGALPTGITVGGASTATHIILTGSATLADYQAALKAITFSNSSETPDTTARDVTVVVNDGDANSNTAHTAIAVVAANDAPTSTADSETTAEDTTVVLGLDDFGTYADIEGTAIAAVKITTLESNGSLDYDTAGDGSGWTAVLDDQVISVADITAGRLRFVPDANENGTPYTTVGFQVSDGTDFSVAEYTLTLNVTAANDAPTSSDDSRTIDEDAMTILTLSDFGTYADVELDAIAAVKITTLESNGSLDYDTAGDGSGWTAVTDDQVISAADITAGRLRFVPDANENGTPYTTVGFQVSDGTDFSVAEYTLTLNVTAVNDAPTVADLVVTETSISFVPSDVDNAVLSLASPFANAFGNPAITSGATTTLAPTPQVPQALSGTLQVTDGTDTADVVGLYLGTNGTNSAAAPLAGSPNAMYGFAGSDSFTGGTGADSLFGGSGNDTLAGGNSDLITGDSANDSLIGGTGDDLLQQTRGADSIDGGANNDRLTFTQTGIGYGDAVGVYVDLAAHISDYDTSDAGNPVGTLVSIENVTGTAGNDSLVGGDATHASDLLGNGVLESFRPLGGSDTITGATGNGVMTRVDYTTSTSAVAVNLGAGAAIDDFGFIDTLVRVDQASGGSGADTLLGGSQEHSSSGGFLEQFLGGPGNDTIDGVGPNAVVGAAGNDRARYDSSPAAVIVNLGATDFVVGMVTVQGSTARDGFGFIDTLLNIDQVLGSNSNDTLVGGNSDHSLIGGPGSDSLVGGTSGVEAAYQTSTAAIVANLAMGTASDGFGGIDTLVNIDDLRGSDFSDTLTGNADDNRIDAGGGADTIDGGGGIDFARYSSTPLANGGINASIENGSGMVNDGMGSIDMLSNIEGLIGTHSSDTLTGGSGDQWFIGRGGNDSINGGAGSDWVSYIDDPAGVTVNLGAPGSATDGWGGVWALGGTDTLNSIENVEGSQFNDSITGDAFANRLEGQGGNDTIVGGAGNDTIAMLVSPGNVDMADGGADTDTLALIGSPGGDGTVTVNLAAGPDIDQVTFANDAPNQTQSNFENVDGSGLSSALNVIGSDGANTIIGSNGNDTIDGGAGDDTIKGGAGADSLAGGADTDTLLYDDSPSRVIVNMLNTGSVIVGADTVLAGTARDGFGTTDTISGFETVVGSAFNDFLQGSTDVVNRLEGGAGNDTLVGSGMSDSIPGAMDDTLLGGTGNDELRQTRGADHLDGGAGTDRLAFITPGAASTTGITYGGTTGVNVNLEAGISDYDTSDASNPVGTLVSIENVSGTAGNDSLVGGDSTHAPDLFGNNVLESFRPLGGNDTITGATGNGFAARVDYSTSTSAVAVNLGAGTAIDDFGFIDTLMQVDQAFGGSGNDMLLGGGQERASVGRFLEQFLGGPGNDTIDGVGPNAVVGAAGTDRVRYDSSPAAVIVNLGTTDFVAGMVTVQGGTAHDGFGFIDTLLNIDEVLGSNSNDTLVGGSSNQVLIGGPGSDLLVGSASGVEAAYQNATGAVTVSLAIAGPQAVGADQGSDTLTNIDDLRGSDFNDTLTGNAANNRINGAPGADVINGGAGIDFASYTSTPLANGGINAFIENGSGAVNDGMGSIDTLTNIEGLIGSHSGDTLTGGSSDQWFQGRGGSDVINGGAGSDWVSYLDDPAGVTVNLGAPGSATDGWGGVWGFGGIDTLNSIENVEGSQFNDSITGDAFANRLEGQGGNDMIDGGAGNDTLDGGGGNDTLNGGNGDDRIERGSDLGLDRVDGGAGSDTLVLRNTLGVALPPTLIEDGATYNARLGLTPASPGFIDPSHIAVSGGFPLGLTVDAVGVEHIEIIGGDSGGTLTINGDFSLTDLGPTTITATGGAGADTLNASGLTSAHRIVANGGSGGDTAISGAGDDLLNGGAGNDTLDGGEGSDFLLGGDGIDSLLGGAGDDLIASGGGADHVDGGDGVDTLLRRSSTSTTTTDLVTGTASGGDTLLNIENVSGSAFNDTMRGNDGANVLRGWEGFDSLTGGNGDDHLLGESGDDTLIGGAGADTLDGGSTPGNPNDTDLVSYFYASSAVTVNLAAGTGAVSGDPADTDTISNIEMVGGSAFADMLTGGNTANDDFERFEGRGGDDTLNGGSGFDEAYYLSAALGVGVIVNLGTTPVTGDVGAGIVMVAAGTATDGEGGTDSLFNIEAVRSSNFADILTGDANNNRFRSQAGSDTIDGGAGIDEADYRSSASVNANLVTGLATDSGGTDVLTSIESLRGSPGNDTFVGNNVANRLRGEGGSDTLIGNEGNDTLEGASGDEFLQGGAGNDVINGGENPVGQLGDSDTASFEDAGTGVTVNLALGSATIGAETDTLIDIERVIGTDFADTLIGGDPKNNATGDSEQFEGRGGNDTIDGGSGGVGSDWAIYTSAPSGVVVDLAAGSALNDGYGAIDTLVNIDRVRGSAFVDQIYGSNNPSGTNERFEGMAGNDFIDGRGGFDYLHYQGSTGAGVIVNLDTVSHLVGPDMVLGGTARDGFDSDLVTPGVQSYTDTFINIEGVRGSGFADTFFGSNNAPGTTEAFEGVGGSDTIDGGGGFDRLEYGRSTSGISVNLLNGTASDGLGGFDTFVNIEAVRGSMFNDSLFGDAGNNILEGQEGGDFLTGGAGNDTLNGGEEPGNQLPEEIDVVNYGNTGAVTGVTVDLELGIATDGLGGTDTLIDIENVRGTEFADMLRGGNPTNSFSGTSEQFEGRGGNDTIDGGIGNDWAIYLNAAAGVHVDLAAGLAINDGDGGVDTLLSIDRVRGSNFDDQIYGSDNPEGTNERFDGRRGHDYIDGRGGLDYAQYNGSLGGVVVDLQLGIATADDGQTDTLVNIEGVRGSNFADLLYGSDNATGFEAFEGQGGNDFIDGRGGIDRVEYAQSDAGVSVNLATGTASDGFGTTDTFVNIESVRGSHHDDQLTGNSGDNTLEGQEGMDTLTGSEGIDTFRFEVTSDSSAALVFSDVITDFLHGTDKIDLSTIDANTAVDFDQEFAFVMLANANTVANSITWSEDVANTRTILQIDNDGDTTADMQIVLQGTGLGLTNADFIL